MESKYSIRKHLYEKAFSIFSQAYYKKSTDKLSMEWNYSFFGAAKDLSLVSFFKATYWHQSILYNLGVFTYLDILNTQNIKKIYSKTSVSYRGCNISQVCW